MASQKDIADKLGISGMTVSRALRGLPSVRPELAEQVRQAAEELGYRPDPLIQSLMAQRRRRESGRGKSGLAIAWLGGGGPVWAKMWGIPRKHPYCRYFMGARKRCGEAGFELADYTGGDYVNWKPIRIGKMLKARGVPGIILGPDVGKRGMSVTNHDVFGLVQVGRSRHEEGIDRVAMDAHRAMATCLDRLKETGYKRIGYIDSVIHNKRNEKRWEAAFMVGQPPEDPIPPLLLDTDRAFTRKRLLAYIGTHQLDAVISGRVQVYQWLREACEVSELGFACPNLQDPGGPVPGVIVNYERIGASAAELLVDAIHGGRRGLQPASRTLSIAGEWHTGELTA